MNAMRWKNIELLYFIIELDWPSLSCTFLVCLPMKCKNLQLNVLKTNLVVDSLLLYKYLNRILASYFVLIQETCLKRILFGRAL